MDRQVDLVIIGAGPAGMAAALYGSRAGLSTVMIDASAPGGKLLKTYQIENYPGVGTVSGPDLAMQMYQQSIAFGAEFLYGEVVEVTQDKKVRLADGTVLEAKAVIIGTGAREKEMGIPNEAEAIGHGESFCAVCDGAFFRNKDVVVIGGGNSALEEAQFLTRFASHVTIVIRRDVFRGSVKAQKEVEENEKISVIYHHIPKEVVLTDGKVSGIVLENVQTKEQQTLACQGIFPFIGQVPETSFVKDLGILNERGYVIANEQLETAVKEIYVAGDCKEKDLRQVVTATADGVIAATNAFHAITGM